MSGYSSGVSSSAAAGFDAVVVAGGGARRLDGVDKALLEVDGRTLLDRVLTACAAAQSTVVVGPHRPTYRPVEWRQEQPPHSGPAAALAAGVAVGSQPWIIALAADLPFLEEKLIHRLWISSAGRDGAILHDPSGRAQWLTACYRRSALNSRISQLGPAALPGLALRELVKDLDLLPIQAPGDSTLDCDTWGDVAQARQRGKVRTEGPDESRPLAD